MQVPAGIRNTAAWQEACRKIHARALDLLEGKLGIIETAYALQPLATWARATQADFAVFRSICAQTLELPVGRERAYWSSSALTRADLKLRAIENRWRQSALASARRLAEKYRWALAARHRHQELAEAEDR